MEARDADTDRKKSSAAAVSAGPSTTKVKLEKNTEPQAKSKETYIGSRVGSRVASNRRNRPNSAQTTGTEHQPPPANRDPSAMASIKNELHESSSTSLRHIPLKGSKKRPAAQAKTGGTSKAPRLDASVEKSASTLSDSSEAPVPSIESEHTKSSTARKGKRQELWQEIQRLDQENKRLDKELRDSKAQMNLMMASLRKDVTSDIQKQTREPRSKVIELQVDEMAKARDLTDETEGCVEDLQKRQKAIEARQDATDSRLHDQVKTLDAAMTQQYEEFIQEKGEAHRQFARIESKLDGMILGTNETFAQLAEESTRQNAHRERLVDGLRRALATE